MMGAPHKLPALCSAPCKGAILQWVRFPAGNDSFQPVVTAEVLVDTLTTLTRQSHHGNSVKFIWFYLSV